MMNERTAARGVHSAYLRFWIGVFAVGIVMLVLGELLAARSLYVFARDVARWLARVGVATSAVALPMGVVSWFQRETTRYDTFTHQQLPSHYRIAAWSLVTIVVLVFSIFIWYTLSHGLVAW